MAGGAPRPAVSVVVPAYNHARFLERRMRSILNQTFGDMEVLVLDDASSDGSADVVQPFTVDPRVRLIRGTTNSGSPFVQWNKGVAGTAAPLVWIAESDDDADERFLATAASRLDAHPNCGLCCTQSLSIDSAGTVHGTLARWTDTVDAEHWRTDYVNDGRDECRRFLAVANTIPSASAVVFRREMFLKTGGAPETMRIAGDWMTWLRMLCVSDIAFVAEPLSRHRSHDRTVRTALDDTPQWWRESLDVWRFALDTLDLPDETRTRIADIVREVIVRLWPRAVTHPGVLRELLSLGRALHPTFTRSLIRLAVTRVGQGRSAPTS